MSDSTICLTNVAADELFELPSGRGGTRYVLSALYRHCMVNASTGSSRNVWRLVKEKNSSLALTAIGKGANQLLIQDREAHEVSYISFLEDFTEIYKNHDILVAPIFKGYGLLNKVVEATAAS